jgi:hypothetical protein
LLANSPRDYLLLTSSPDDAADDGPRRGRGSAATGQDGAADGPDARADRRVLALLRLPAHPPIPATMAKVTAMNVNLCVVFMVRCLLFKR